MVSYLSHLAHQEITHSQAKRSIKLEKLIKMNFTNANRQLDFKEAEQQQSQANQYPGFVRRESSGYQKYYPLDQQIQLYKPKPAPFYGQTTAGDSY